jgi:RNA 3'-phosphate cyclase
MGVQAELAIERRGYYPRGGGEIRVTLPPTRGLTPFTAQAPGAVDHIETRVHVARLARQIAERMEAAARAALPPGMPVDATIDVCSPERAGGPGGAIVLRALAAHTVLGAAEVAERGVSAEHLGRRAALALARDLQAGATLDLHAADQMLVFMALAQGPSVFRAAQVSSHAATTMGLLETLTTVRFQRHGSGAGVVVHVRP